MREAYRVEWTSPDPAGAFLRHTSHDMPQRDADGMAETLRSADVARDIIVVPAN